MPLILIITYCEILYKSYLLFFFLFFCLHTYILNEVVDGEMDERVMTESRYETLPKLKLNPSIKSILS